jgi:hypothetical protein
MANRIGDFLSNPYGTPAEPDAVDRIVPLSPDSRWVNVAYGETVEFVVQSGAGSARSFAWRFDVSPVVSHVDLSRVAPAGFLDHEVRVFVAADPRYRGG